MLLALAKVKPYACSQQKKSERQPMAGGMHHMRSPFELISKQVADADYQ